MTHRLGFAAALAVLLVLFAIGALLLVERWGNRRRERAERERLVREFPPFVASLKHRDNVVEFPLRGGRQ